MPPKNGSVSIHHRGSGAVCVRGGAHSVATTSRFDNRQRPRGDRIARPHGVGRPPVSSIGLLLWRVSTNPDVVPFRHTLWRDRRQAGASIATSRPQSRCLRGLGHRGVATQPFPSSARLGGRHLSHPHRRTYSMRRLCKSSAVWSCAASPMRRSVGHCGRKVSGVSMP